MQNSNQPQANKPLELVIMETKEKISTILNESGLPPLVIQMVLQEQVSGIQMQMPNYIKMLNENYLSQLKAMEKTAEEKEA